MAVKPFNATFFMLLAIGAILFITIRAVFKNQSVKSKKIFLVIMSAANIALYFTYKACLSVDAEFVAISGISKFNWFNELPLQLCNINLFLIPIGALIGSRAIMGFSFFTAPLGAGHTGEAASGLGRLVVCLAALMVPPTVELVIDATSHQDAIGAVEALGPDAEELAVALLRTLAAHQGRRR